MNIIKIIKDIDTAFAECKYDKARNIMTEALTKIRDMPIGAADEIINDAEKRLKKDDTAMRFLFILKLIVGNRDIKISSVIEGYGETDAKKN